MTDTARLHSGREVIYACLSNIFLDIPGDNFYNMLETFTDAVTPMKEDNKDIADSVSKLSDLIKAHKNLTDGERLTFDKDTVRAYTTTYCLTNSVPLFESVYTSPAGLTHQESTEQVLKLYRRYAFDMKHYSNEPADHISYELMFMAYLAKKTAKLISDKEFEKAGMLISAQKEFLNNHLLKWVVDFAESTEQKADAGKLYSPAARFMAAYINEDNEFISIDHKERV